MKCCLSCLGARIFFGVSSVPCYNLEGDEPMVTLQIRTTSRSQMVDITDRVAEALKSQGVQNGIAFVFVPHTTAGITINENADPDVVHDILFALAAERVPPHRGQYRGPCKGEHGGLVG